MLEIQNEKKDSWVLQDLLRWIYHLTESDNIQEISSKSVKRENLKHPNSEFQVPWL
jgi:hypothetical protein